MERDPEAARLRLYITRLRAALRYALDSRVEAILRELIGEMEERLDELEAEILKASRPSRQKAPHSK